MRVWAACVALVVVGATVTCASEPPIPPALSIDVDTGVSTWGFTPISSEVLLVGTAPLRVLDELVFESATLEMEHGSLELLTARISLFACPTCRPRTDVSGYGGIAGSSCSYGPWPPRGFGPTYPLDGFRVAPGDRPSLVVYVRPQSRHAMSKGINVTYRDASGRRRLEMRNERIKVEPTDDPKGDHCADSLWFGGTDNPDVARIRPLGPSATP